MRNLGVRSDIGHSQKISHAGARAVVGVKKGNVDFAGFIVEISKIELLRRSIIESNLSATVVSAVEFRYE